MKKYGRLAWLRSSLLVSGLLVSGLLVSGLLVNDAPAIAQSIPTRSTQPSRQTAVSSSALRQYERVYVSARGELLGAYTIFGGSVLFIDRNGEIALAARDYTAELDYDYAGRLNRIGTIPISYDYRGRVEQIGNSAVDYDFRSRLGQIAGDAIAYTSRGQVSQIGTVTFQYDRGAIETISSNYTSNGTQVVIVGRR